MTVAIVSVFILPVTETVRVCKSVNNAVATDGAGSAEERIPLRSMARYAAPGRRDRLERCVDESRRLEIKTDTI